MQISSSIDHDSNYTTKLIDTHFVNKDIFNTYKKLFLADSAYSGLVRIENLTSVGFDRINKIYHASKMVLLSMKLMKMI